MISTANSLDPGQLAAMVAVIEEGSFDRAAARLHVTRSAVSQRIKQLELRLGQIVIRRGTPCLPTAAGEALLRYGKQVEFLSDEASRELSASAGDAATVAIAVNADSLATWFLAAIAPFTVQGAPMFELLVDDQDHTAAMLRAGRVMAAVTADPHPVQGCSVEPLGAMRYVAVASPDFLSRHFPRGVTTRALEQAPTLTFNRKDRLQAQILKKLTGKALQPPIHWIPSPHGFVEAALLGIGWGTVPISMAEAGIQAGTLRRLRRDAVLDVPLFWQHWRLDTPLMRDLTRAVVTAPLS
jgi:LysR family transcriptional regulator, chromosome initiation inhibitor